MSASADWLEGTSTGVTIEVLVQPRASKTRIIGPHDGRLKIALAAPPVDGAANEELCRTVAQWLGVRTGQVTLRAGATSRRKRLDVAGVTQEQVRLLLGLT